MDHYGVSNAVKLLKLQNEVYQNELRETDTHISREVPNITIPLYPHQAAVVQRMTEIEKNVTNGWDISGQTLFSSYGILGDNVGVGKSLMILSHIAQLKHAPQLKFIPKVSVSNCPFIYSIHNPKSITDISQASPILIVPHTLFRQWTTYIKVQTKFKPLLLSTRKHIEKDLVKNLFSHDLTLITNTMLPYFVSVLPKHVYFQRVFIDEADSIKIPSISYLKTSFTWLISASWPNLLLCDNIFANGMALKEYILTSSLHPEIKEQFLSIGLSSMYLSQYYNIQSSNYFKNMIDNKHPLRSQLIVKCSREFINQSISLPPLYRTNILCSPSLTQQIVSGFITPEVQNLLHAGDIQSALQHLGVRDEQPLTLIQAVTDNRLKELDRLKKTYDFKASLEYNNPHAKEQALANLKSKISHLEEQINSIRERIENYQKEICPICFDEPQSAVLIACCNRVFCAACILNSLARNPSCPLCRAKTTSSQLRQITETKQNKNIKQEDKPLRKKEMLLKILRENPKGKFLIFSKYDNPFSQIESEIQAMNIKVRHVKGTKDMIQSTLNSFAKGESQCLLLNSDFAGAGLNITAASHVILLHAMSIEEEKQILGRAYRLGRKEPLTMFRLLHPDEMTYN
jgi:SNF2 family DNA or RNA helicase